MSQDTRVIKLKITRRTKQSTIISLERKKVINIERILFIRAKIDTWIARIAIIEKST